MAAARLDDLRRPVLQRRREPALERVRRLHDVVVDRDDGVLHGPRRRVREEQVVGNCHGFSLRLTREQPDITSSPVTIRMLDDAIVRMLQRHWEDGWNQRDVDPIMAPFAANVVFSSPGISMMTGDASQSTIAGYDALRAIHRGRAAPHVEHSLRVAGHARRDRQRGAGLHVHTPRRNREAGRRPHARRREPPDRRVALPLLTNFLNYLANLFGEHVWRTGLAKNRPPRAVTRPTVG